MEALNSLMAPLAIGVVGMALGGCGATDPGGAEETAERFYRAVAAEDGAAACEELSKATREQLEQDEQKPCDEAVLTVELSGKQAVKASAFIGEAKVDLDGGDSAFLEETPAGWEVTAAGCKPVPGEESPYDCEVES